MVNTVLRLGLSNGGENYSGINGNNNYGKRCYHEEIAVDLKLNLAADDNINENHLLNDSTNPPPAKAQVVGWPPIGSFRRNTMAAQKGGDSDKTEKGGGGAAAFVKVSMDGAPYLRKVDLKMYVSYQELSDALGKMFGSFTMGKCQTQLKQGMVDFMNERKLIDLLNNSDYVPTYEDKDGDLMLVGDVPWEMFVESCKRLRIMKGTEAKGLAPRAMEKCKSRS